MIRELSPTGLKIIEIANRLFYAHGHHWVSFQMIANELGTSQPALYKHFKDKDALIYECCDQASMKGREFVVRHAGASRQTEDQLRRYAQAHILWTLEKPVNAHANLAMYYLAASHPKIKILRHEINRAGVARIASLLQNGVEGGLWDISDVRPAARSIHSLLLGEMFKTLYWPKEIPRRQRNLRLWDGVQRLLFSTF